MFETTRSVKIANMNLIETRGGYLPTVALLFLREWGASQTMRRKGAGTLPHRAIRGVACR